MSISTENSKDLESYGVWVKNNSNDEKINTENNDIDSFDLPEETINQDEMPDFSEDLDNMDFSDMFKDDSQFSSEQKQETVDDSTLTTDELANISSEIPEFDAPSEDFQVENEIKEPVEDTTEETVNDNQEEEISLDDFFDGDTFSDESVASGNNGMEAKSSTEEISLDDFLDDESFTSSKQEEEIPDEKPLNMDLTFEDDKAFETENNESLNDDYDTEPEAETETVSDTIDNVDFDLTSSMDSDASDSNKAQSDFSVEGTESVDLSDFGIDENAEETPVVQNVEEAKNKEKIIDYNLSVSDDNIASAPNVNIVKDKSNDNAAPQNDTETVSSTLLQQIINDLSGLKNEINVLKHNLEEIKQSDNIPEIQKEETSDGGFFWQ